MNEISLHILDIIQNSIKADATLVIIKLEFCKITGLLSVEIIDNGVGMDESLLEKVTNPFITTRTTRKVGFGLSLFKASAEATGGSFYISSELNAGTTIKATFYTNHLDCPPLGAMTETLVSQVICYPDMDFIYKFITTDGIMNFDTREIKHILGEKVSMNNPAVITWMTESINEEIKEIGGGTIV